MYLRTGGGTRRACADSCFATQSPVRGRQATNILAQLRFVLGEDFDRPRSA